MTGTQKSSRAGTMSCFMSLASFGEPEKKQRLGSPGFRSYHERCYDPELQASRLKMVDYSNIPRDSRRVPLETRVQFKFDRFDGFISEYSANISPGGLFLRTRVPQPPGTVLDFEFRLGDGFELIRGRGEVVWNRLEDEGPARPAGMGLRFQSLSEGSKELIYRIVDQHILHG